jgi:ethanolamine utilization protein EutA
VDDWGQLDGIMFSGGVGEYVYRREMRDFGDLGKLFGEAVRQRLEQNAVPAPLLPAGECIRATVLGASEYSVQLSGNTTFISEPAALLPRKNLQVIPLNLELKDAIDPVEIAEALGKSFRRHDLVIALVGCPVIHAFECTGTRHFEWPARNPPTKTPPVHRDRWRHCSQLRPSL